VSGDPIEFLRARLADDDAAVADGEAACIHYSKCDDDGENWLGRFTTDRARLDIDVRRRILDLHDREPGQHPDFCGHDKHELPCPTLRLLMLPFADLPGYRPEWAPQ
jgi:hypothetical protein